MTIAALISESCDAARADPSWLGSVSHLGMLQESLVEVFGLSDVELSWGPSGTGSYWEHSTRKIVLERPGPSPNGDVDLPVEGTVLVLLHESLHARYSGSTPEYHDRLETANLFLRPTIERIFNRLEDARLNRVATEADPDLDPFLRRFAGLAVDELQTGWRRNASTPEPDVPRAQLLFAILVYALTPERAPDLHPMVEAELGHLRGLIDRAREGTTERCGAAAFELAGRVSNFAIDQANRERS